MNAPQHFRPLTFGEVLDGSFTLYRRHFVTMLVTALIPLVPMSLLWSELFATMLRAEATGDEAAVARVAGLFLLMALVGMMATVVMWAALTRQMAQGYMGGEVSVGDGYRAGIQALLPLIGVGIVLLIAAWAVAFALAIVAGILVSAGAAMGDDIGVVFAVLAILGVFVGYIALAALLFAIVPAIVVERKGPFRAIGRSVELAKGAVWKIVGIFCITFLIMLLPVIGLAFLTGFWASVSATPETMPTTQLYLQQSLSMLVWALVLPFFIGNTVLLYFDRRVRTEAYDLEQAADALAFQG